MASSAENSPDDPVSENGWLQAAPPEAIADLAAACVSFVERAFGTKMDFTVETLPLLDHYLEQARGIFAMKPRGTAEEPAELVTRAASAYLGEVIRRRYPCWWRLGNPTPSGGDEHRLEFHRLHLIIYPGTLVGDALHLDASRGGTDRSGFELDPEDARAAEQRLSDLPAVELEEFVRPSTRIEVLDIVLDAVRTEHARSGADPLELSPTDYVH